MRKILRRCTIVLGAACILCSGILLIDNQRDESTAQAVSLSVTQTFHTTVTTQEAPLAQLITLDETLVETVEIDGADYMALLTIPTLGLELPVDDTCTYSKLANTPCMFTGSIQENNLIIAAHNYAAHFGSISQLDMGDVVTLLDASGVLHTYTYLSQETVDGNDLEGLCSGDWDLTLFTCLYADNSQRVVVRFECVDFASQTS